MGKRDGKKVDPKKDGEVIVGKGDVKKDDESTIFEVRFFPFLNHVLLLSHCAFASALFLSGPPRPLPAAATSGHNFKVCGRFVWGAGLCAFCLGAR